MKKLLLCALCLLLLASCGRQQEPTVVAGDPDETNAEEAFTIDLTAEIETAAEPTAKELSCEPLKKDGALYGFEMRFRRTDALEELMGSEDNFYFGVLQSGKKKIAIPIEEIRVLLDVPTDSFVVTLLAPQDEKLSGSSVTVSFYISARADGASKALFAAQQTVDIS